jgi:alpha-L-rhamnosidase
MKEDETPHLFLNHYSYGAIGSWLYQVVAGIEIGSPGYKQIIFQLQPGGGLTHAQATYRSLYGEIASQWHLHDGMFTLTVTVPPNTSATVRLPAGSGKGVTESGHALSIGEGIKKVRQEGCTTLVEVGAGTYTFAYAWQTALSADA